MLSVLTDENGHRFGNKTTTLELAGMVVPILLDSSIFKNKETVFQVDNIACLFGWESRSEEHTSETPVTQ